MAGGQGRSPLTPPGHALGRNEYKLLWLCTGGQNLFPNKSSLTLLGTCVGDVSAPAIFCAVASSLEWILQQRGVRACIHYMDDFLHFGDPNSIKCQEAPAVTLATCQELEVLPPPGRAHVLCLSQHSWIASQLRGKALFIQEHGLSLRGGDLCRECKALQKSGAKRQHFNSHSLRVMAATH